MAEPKPRHFSSALSRSCQIAEDVVEDAAVAVVFDLVEGIDAADDGDVAGDAIGTSHLGDHLLAWLNGL